jgi:hypothetical protein
MNKRIAWVPLKATKGLKALTPEMDCNQMAEILHTYSALRLQYYDVDVLDDHPWCLCYPLVIKHEWYVLLCVPRDALRANLSYVRGAVFGGKDLGQRFLMTMFM